MSADVTSNKNYSKILHETISKKYKKRIIVNKLVTIFAIICVIAAIVPLGSILLEVVKNGASAISFEFLTQPQGSIGSGRGGIGPAIQGTIIVVGLASIIVGIVGYVIIVLSIGSFSVLAGAISLSIIMIPIVVRVTEETLKIVPYSFREAGYSLGISKAKITLSIV